MLDFMDIRYEMAHDVKALVDEIVKAMNFHHIVRERVLCIRSRGSRAKRTVARIHGLPRIWQTSLKTQPYYAIEVISERYDSLSGEEKEKTIIHELLHVPKSFRGGFRHHRGWINRRKIEGLHKILVEKRKLGEGFQENRQNNVSTRTLS